MSRKLTRKSPLAQAKEVTQFWQDDPVYQEISRWLEDAQGSGITSIAQPETMITGTVLVQMSSDEAEQMRQDLPDAEVLPDQPIELIRPLRDDSKTERSLLPSPSLTLSLTLTPMPTLSPSPSLTSIT